MDSICGYSGASLRASLGVSVGVSVGVSNPIISYNYHL